jgi:U3 small nucleolar RNA-associated protein 3
LRADEFLEPSDEEVLGYSSGEDDDDDDDDMEVASDHGAETKDSKHKHTVQDEEDDAAGWGPSKKDYYNADAIETEQDALDEEAEARRIQQKGLAAMTEADFGFDEDEWLAEGQDGEDSGNVVTEVLPQLQITDDMTEKEKLKILKTRYPEFEFISKEFLRLQPLHDELAAAANAAERLVKARAAKSATSSTYTPPTPMAVTKYRACAAYLAAMAMYFAILGSTAKEDGSAAIAMDPAELHEHAVMESLLKCQGLWARVESLPVADPMVEPINGDELSIIDEDDSIPDTHFNKARSQKKKEKKEGRKTKKEVAAEEAQATAEARRAEKLRKTEEELTTLSSLTDPSALRKAAKKQKKEQPMLNLLNADDSDFGEETSFTAHELAEKAKKKKSLRFYTSQIVQKAIKRDAAGKDQGGDADIPHRERLRDRQARLQAEAEKRGQGLAKKKAPGVTLGEGGDSDDDNEGPAKPLATDGDDDYYDMIAARGTAKKEAKQELADAYRLAAKEGGNVVPQEVIGADGKRKITYMIQKNKGLTPHRSKTVRNPRVKKKLKYEKKKKQLKSMKAVYSGGEARGGYGGELTGIKKGLVRSTKL